ncbi:MAG: L-2-hydroxyglutarate oxidase [Nitrospirota bacterium]
MTEKADIVICGGGIIGLAIARELLKNRHENIVILEKEQEIGMHASGRNSGVLHAGIYYTPESLKAKLCIKGNILMKEYCREKNIPVLNTGKVIVARNENEIPALKELYQRALENKTGAELIDEKKLKTIEPYARTQGLAIFSPHTSVVDPVEVLKGIEQDIMSSGKVKVLKGEGFKSVRGDNEAVTENRSIKFDLFINAAGSYSDKIAHMFGTGLNYLAVPFKGTYKKLKKEKNYLVKGNIYPVPDSSAPFLGVHFTKAADGTVYIGPTAIPAFGRENYGFLKGIDSEGLKILYRDIILFFENAKFRKIALSEPGKYTLKSFFEDVKDMIDTLIPQDIEHSSKVGIRPQLIDWQKKELVMDFVILKSGNSLHILNTISPGFTSSMAFAELVVSEFII